MSDKSFKLSKNAWHAKLMNFIWRFQTSDFSHMCPYFWLSVFNLIALPIILPIIGISRGWDAVADYFERKKSSKKQKRIIKVIDVITRMVKDEDYYNSIVQQYLTHFEVIFFSPAWADARIKGLFNNREDLSAFVRKYDADSDIVKYRLLKEYEEKERLKESKLLTAKQKINKILSYIKPITTALFWLVSGGLLAFLLILIYSIGLWIATIKIKVASEFLLAAGITIGLVLLMLFVIKLLFTIDFSTTKSFATNERTTFGKVLDIAALPFIWLWKGLATIGVVIAEIYKNNCPPIDWE